MRRKATVTLILLVSLLLLGLAREAWIRRGVRGVYLVDGGLDFVEITGGFWRPEFRPHKWIPDRNLNPMSVASGDMINGRIGFQSGRMKISYQTKLELLIEYGDRPIEEGFRLLRRGVKGSWNLVQYQEPRTEMQAADPKVGRPFTVSIPSYLHRVEDRDLLGYFKTQREEMNSAEALEIAGRLLARHADDPYVRTLYLGAVLRRRDEAKLKRRLEEWRPDFEDAADPYLQRIPQLADYAIRALEADRQGVNGFKAIWGFYSALPSLDMLEQQLLEWRQPPLLYYPPDEIFRTVEALGPYNNFLEFQVGAKCARVISALTLFGGDWERSFGILAGVLDQGRALNQNCALIETLIGSAFMAISARGLEVYALNCILEPGDEIAFLNRIGRAPDANFEAYREALRLFESPLETLVGSGTRTNLLEIDTRSRTSYAMVENVRVAAAVRASQARTGRLPDEIRSLAPEFLTGLPRDPHQPGQSLRYALASTDEAFVYSVGPDQQDQKAAVSYDPTNGAVSLGDVFVRIPREREFPFVRGGMKAVNAEALLRQFPHGLPVDVFATTRGRGLGVSEENGVVVYSYGPDADEPDTYSVRQLEVMYDPTNGTTSNGDLFVRLRD